jgi:hypothetical protein
MIPSEVLDARCVGRVVLIGLGIAELRLSVQVVVQQLKRLVDVFSIFRPHVFRPVSD